MMGIAEVANTFLTAAVGLILFWMVRGGFRDVDRRFEQVEACLDRMDGRLDRVEGRIDHLAARIDSLQGHIHEVRADITGLAVRLIGPREAEGGN